MCHRDDGSGCIVGPRSRGANLAWGRPNEWLRHSDLRMAQRYIALQADEGERIADALDGFGAGGV